MNQADINAEDAQVEERQAGKRSPGESAFTRTKRFFRNCLCRKKRLMRSRAARCFFRILPYALTLAYAILLAFSLSRHEMWRDEIQAWLLARGASTPWELFSIMKYEGHPCLWHLLLWPFAHFWDNPAGMQLLHWLLISGAMLLLFRFSPFPWILRIAIALGYFFSYEWAVISRNYALSAVLLFAVCALWKKRWKYSIPIALLLFLYCHSNFHSTLLTIALLPLLMIDYAVAYAGNFHSAKRYFLRNAAAFLLIASGIATAILQVKPPEDSGFAEKWYFTLDEKRIQLVAGSVFDAFLPIPKERLRFWNEHRFLSKNTAKESPSPYYIAPEQRPRYALWLLFGLALIFFYRRPWAGIQFLAGWILLEFFFYVKYPGLWRHHGMIYLWFLACFWISFYYKPWRLPWRWPDRIAAFPDRCRNYLLFPLLLLHCYGASIALKTDWKEEFSMAEDTAEFIREELGDPEEFIFVAQNGPIASTLCGYLGGEAFYYLESDRFGTYIIWDKKRNRNPAAPFPRLRISGTDGQKKLLYVYAYRVPGKLIPPDVRFLKGFEGAVSGESYFLYLREQ